jgi:hypothetical protein
MLMFKDERFHLDKVTTNTSQHTQQTGLLDHKRVAGIAAVAVITAAFVELNQVEDVAMAGILRSPGTRFGLNSQGGSFLAEIITSWIA